MVEKAWVDLVLRISCRVLEYVRRYARRLGSELPRRRDLGAFGQAGRLPAVPCGSRMVRKNRRQLAMLRRTRRFDDTPEGEYCAQTVRR